MALMPFHPRISLRQFVRSSLRWRLWLLLLGTIFTILLSLTVLISQMTRSYMRKNVISTSENLIYQGAQNLENYLHTVEAATLIPYSNSTLYQSLTANSSPVYEADTYIGLTLKAIASSEPSIYQVHLYADGQKSSYLVQSSIFQKGFCEAAPEEQPLTLESMHESDSYGVSSVKHSPSVPVVSLHRTLYRVPEESYIGQIDIDLTPDYFDSVMQKLKTDESECVILVWADGRILYTPSKGFALPLQIMEQLPESEKTGSFLYSQDSRNNTIVFFSTLHLECGDFYLFKLTPAEVINAGGAQMIRILWLLTFVILIASSAILFAISAHFTAPIARLAKHMEYIGQGNMAESITTDRTDEVGRLITQFQTMMDNINELIRQKYALELSNKNNQLLALQAQLNPHFISNTIQSIGSGALQAGNRETYIQLSSFGNMLQYCMDFSVSLVPLAQEIQFVEHYLFFQKLRFPNRFIYSIQVPEYLLNISMPKMLLQPLVENAFVHGRLQERSNGFLLLTISEENHYLTIRVEDNGVGADEAALEHLRAGLKDSASALMNADHIGIRTSYARIQLYYGNSASIQVHNRQRGGFVLELRMPEERESNDSSDC